MPKAECTSLLMQFLRVGGWGTWWGREGSSLNGELWLPDSLVFRLGVLGGQGWMEVGMEGMVLGFCFLQGARA